MIIYDRFKSHLPYKRARDDGDFYGPTKFNTTLGPFPYEMKLQYFISAMDEVGNLASTEVEDYKLPSSPVEEIITITTTVVEEYMPPSSPETQFPFIGMIATLLVGVAVGAGLGFVIGRKRKRRGESAR